MELKVFRLSWEFDNIFICSRTPGSRQPSPAEEELSKNNLAMPHGGVVILKPDEHHLQQLPTAFAPHPHLGPGGGGGGVGPGQTGLTLGDTVNHFEHFVTAAAAAGAAGAGQPTQPDGQYDATGHLAAQGGYVQAPQQQVDGVLQQQQHNFDVQVGHQLFFHTKFYKLDKCCHISTENSLLLTFSCVCHNFRVKNN